MRITLLLPVILIMACDRNTAADELRQVKFVAECSNCRIYYIVYSRDDGPYSSDLWTADTVYSERRLWTHEETARRGDAVGLGVQNDGGEGRTEVSIYVDGELRWNDAMEAAEGGGGEVSVQGVLE